MLRMSKLADYSFILLAQMVNGGKPAWSASELADRTTLPLPTVAKLMKILAKAGLVSGQRGAAGGYRLAVSPKDISVARIVEAVDGPIALTDCVMETEVQDCAVKSLCPLHGGWSKVNRAMRVALDSVYLSDLISSGTKQEAKPGKPTAAAADA